MLSPFTSLATRVLAGGGGGGRGKVTVYVHTGHAANSKYCTAWLIFVSCCAVFNYGFAGDYTLQCVCSSVTVICEMADDFVG